MNRAHPARIIHIISKGGDEGSGPQDCSLGQALRLQFPVEVSDLYGRLSTHVAYISGESAGKFQFCLGECFGRSAPRFLRSEERRVGKEGVSTCRSRWSRNNKKKNKQ